MLGEFVLRLAIALPIVCGLAVVSILAVKRGWLRLPSLPSLPSLSGFANLRSATIASADVPLHVVSVRSLSPAARLAVVRFAGRELLIGVSGQGLLLLAERQPAGGQPFPHADCQEPAA